MPDFPQLQSAGSNILHGVIHGLSFHYFTCMSIGAKPEGLKRLSCFRVFCML